MFTVNEKMTALADAIREKSGVTTPLSLDTMKNAVESIEIGNGESSGLKEEGCGQYSVILVDTDATIIKRIWGNEGDTITLPANPGFNRRSEDLEFIEWCSAYEFGDTEEGLKTITLKDEDVVVGAIWGLSNDANIQIETIKLEGDFTMGIGGTGTISIDWGDGTVNENINLSQINNGAKNISHSYSELKEYKIKIIDQKESGSSIEFSLVDTERIYKDSSCFNNSDYIKNVKIKNASNTDIMLHSQFLANANNLELITVNKGCNVDVNFLRGAFSKLKTIFLKPMNLLCENDFWDDFTGCDLEYYIFGESIQGGIYSEGGFLNNSKIKHFNVREDMSFYGAFKNCNNLTRIVGTSFYEGTFVSCINLKEIIFNPSSNGYAGGYAGFTNTPNLEKIVFKEGCKLVEFVLSSWGSDDGDDLCGVKYIQCPSTLETFNILEFGVHQGYAPNLQIIDFSKLTIVPRAYPSNIEGDILQELLGWWEPHPSAILRVNKYIIDEWKAHPIWGRFGDRIIGV